MLVLRIMPMHTYVKIIGEDRQIVCVGDVVVNTPGEECMAVVPCGGDLLLPPHGVVTLCMLLITRVHIIRPDLNWFGVGW